MRNTLHTFIALLICLFPVFLTAQADVRVLIEDENNNISVALYDHQTNAISNSFSLNNTALDGYFFSEATAFDYLADKLITVGDTSMAMIDVQTGAISAISFPFSTTGGFNAAFRFSGVQGLIYGLVEDANGDYSIISYNYATQTVALSISLNGTSVASGGFFGASATYNDFTGEMLTSGDNGIHTVNVNSGLVATKPLPFSGAQGYNLSLHYDEIRNKVFALFEESNGNVSVATYDFASNTLSGVNSLAGTAVANGFYSEGAGYSSAWRKIIVTTDNGIATVDPISGAVTQMAFPFAATNGFEIVFRPWVPMVAADPAADQTLFSMSPNPASDVLYLKFETAKPGQLKLMGLDGRILHEMTVRGGQAKLDVSQLPGGIYLAQFANEAGAQTRKIVVE